MLPAVKEWLHNAYQALSEHPFINGVVPHLLTVAGFLLAFFAIARLISDRRQPSNTFAWLLAIAFIPYLGVPLYLLMGGRKIRRLAARKTRLFPTVPGAAPSPAADSAISRVLILNGATPPLAGNRIEFIASGEEAFARLEQGIRDAKHTIHVMTFILARDATGRRDRKSVV